MDQNLKIRAKIISDLLAGFGSSASGSPEQITAAYLTAIDGIATPYVSEAAKRLLSGQVTRSSASFAPSPTELALESRRIQNKHLERVEQQERSRLLIESRPEPMDAAEIARRKAFVEKMLTTKLKRTPDAEADQEAQARKAKRADQTSSDRDPRPIEERLNISSDIPF